MKPRIWRLAGVGLLCMAMAANAAAEGAQDQLRGSSNGGQRGPGSGNGGQNHGGGQSMRPQPSAGNPGQWQNRPAQNNPGQWQGRPSGGGNQNQWQGSRPDQGRPGDGPSGGGQPNNRPPIIGKPDEVRQTQSPLRGSYPDLRRDSGRHWEAGGPGQRPGNDWPGGHGNGWGPGPQYRPGHVIDRFPGQNYRVPYRGQDYFFSGGYWYRPQGPRYVVVQPPYGVRVRYLPDYAERMWIGSSVFFLAAGTYYQWADTTQEYIVVNPPVNAPPAQVVPASTGYDVAAYPAQGQSPQLIAQDQYECRRWAAEQSRFDPANVTYAPAPEVVAVYRQSLANCFASRGYSVN